MRWHDVVPPGTVGELPGTVPCARWIQISMLKTDDSLIMI